MADAATKYVGLNDIETHDQDEMIGFDPSADLYRTKPITPGVYTGRVKFASDNPEERWQESLYSEKYPDREGKPYYRTTLIAQITDDGPFQNRVVRTGFFSTGIFREGTSEVASFLKTAGEDLTGIKRQGELIELLENTLAGEPILRFGVDWEWNYQDPTGEYVRLRGARKYAKQTDSGELNPVMVVDTIDGENQQVVARPFITRFMPAR